MSYLRKKVEKGRNDCKLTRMFRGQFETTSFDVPAPCSMLHGILLTC